MTSAEESIRVETVRMTSEERTVVGGLVVVAIVVPVALKFALHWPSWAALLLVVALLLVPFQVRRSMLFRAQQRELRDQALAQQKPPPPPPPQQQPTRAELEPAPTPQPQFQRDVLPPVPLDSAAEGYDFLVAATVYWRAIPRPGGWQHGNPAAVAIQSILVRAREVTSTELPHRYGVVQYRLNNALGAVLGDGSGLVEAWAAQVQVTLGENDLARLRRLSDVRKDQDIWELERHHERDRRAYLADDVLKNTGSAVVWWLAHAKDNIDLRDTVNLIGSLRQLAAAANSTDVPELDLDSKRPAIEPPPPTDHTIAGRVRDLMDALDLDEPARIMFVRRMMKVFTGTGRPSAAGELKQVFDPEDPDPDPEPKPTPEPEPEPEPEPDSRLEVTLNLPRVTDLPPEPDWTGPMRSEPGQSDMDDPE